MTTDKQLTANDLIYIELYKVAYILNNPNPVSADVLSILEKTAVTKLNK